VGLTVCVFFLENEMSDIDRLADLKCRYEIACHAMQTGVAYKMAVSPNETNPKHLRVGINSAMVETSVLFKIMLKRGLITEIEFYEILCETMEEEAKGYQSWIEVHIGKQVKLF